MAADILTPALPNARVSLSPPAFSSSSRASSDELDKRRRTETAQADARGNLAHTNGATPGTGPLLSGRAFSTQCRSQIRGLMRLRLFDPAALPELRQHFVRSGFSVA